MTLKYLWYVTNSSEMCTTKSIVFFYDLLVNQVGGKSISHGELQFYRATLIQSYSF